MNLLLSASLQCIYSLTWNLHSQLNNLQENNGLTGQCLPTNYDLSNESITLLCSKNGGQEEPLWKKSACFNKEIITNSWLTAQHWSAAESLRSQRLGQWFRGQSRNVRPAQRGSPSRNLQCCISAQSPVTQNRFMYHIGVNIFHEKWTSVFKTSSYTCKIRWR